MSETTSADYRHYLSRRGADYLTYTDYDSSPVHRNRLAFIVDAIDERAGGHTCRIADVGCGTGNITIPLASRGHTVDGTDIDANSIELAQARNSFPNLTFACAGLEGRNFGSYDFIVLSEVLEHVEQYESLFREITGPMQRDACLLLTVPNGWSPVEIACRPSYALKKSELGTRIVRGIRTMLQTQDYTTANKGTPHVQFFRLRQLQQLFRRSNMRVAQAQGFFFAWPAWEIFLARFPSEELAARDFRLSQELPMQLRAMWCFALLKC